MWILFFLLIHRLSHGKPYDKEVFRNERNELVVRWENPLGEFFSLKQHHKQIFKWGVNKFEPLQVIDQIDNTSLVRTTDYPVDINGDTSGRLYVLDCSGQITKLTPYQQNYVREVVDHKDNTNLQFDYSDTSLCAVPFKRFIKTKNSVSLSNIVANLGITITGSSTATQTGVSVSIGGDVNGDGNSDMLIGASGYSSNTGRAYLIYGGSTLTNIALGSLTPTQGITITGESPGSYAGITVSIGGDVNGDGKADMLISVYSATDRVYLIYGGSSLTNIALGSFTSTQGIIITGESTNSNSISVSIGGDVNGDGKADMLLGAESFSSNTGRVYLIYGSSSLTNIALGSLTPSQGITITGQSTGSYTGCSVSIGGDVNGDGKADILIGAYGYSSNTYVGRAYLIYGSANLANIALGSLTLAQGIIITGETSNTGTGASVSIGGDVNGDGKADMLIGAYQYVSATGRVYLIYGGSNLANIALGSLTPSQGITITGESAISYTGSSVSICGDVNGDGKADMLLGANGYSSHTGRAYLIYGDTGLTNIALGSLTPSQGITITGESTSSITGVSVSIGGDVDEDGKADMLIGASGYSSNTGRAYLIYGSPLANIVLHSDDPTSQPTGQPTMQPTRQPTAQPVCRPSGQPSAQPSSQPTGKPISPSSVPSRQPSSRPTRQPTSQPSGAPTARPAAEPTCRPVSLPTSTPTEQPSSFPTQQPISVPSHVPSCQPTSFPSVRPSSVPSAQPSQCPISHPSAMPSVQPSSHPTRRPTNQPSNIPTRQPTSFPTTKPSRQPTSHPSCQPINVPTSQPSVTPSVQPTGVPSSQPNAYPSSLPTVVPSSQPTETPSKQPIARPTTIPSQQPTGRPSRQPSSQPSSSPTRKPSALPTEQPTNQPSSQPVSAPTSLPSGQPTLSPTNQPSSQPSSQPRSFPSVQPTGFPTIQPTTKPSGQPSRSPSSPPSKQPSSSPTNQPSSFPTRQPSSQPSKQPTSRPSIYKMHCFNQTYYSFIDNDCLDCPVNSFNNITGASFCMCNGGYYEANNSSVINPKLLDCQTCSPGEFSLPGAVQNCTLCPLGSFSKNYGSKHCEKCPLNFYNSNEGQFACKPCPNGRSTAVLGAISASQCISPIPNFTLGFFALFLVVIVFSWYIVFGKFQRVSFERRTKTVEPNIEKCRQMLISEEELHYQHLITVQEKRNTQKKKFKFISFVLISFLLIILSVVGSLIYFTYQVFFTSLILWRGMKVDFKLSPILDLLAQALKGITQYMGFPVDIVFFLALPFLYLFEALDSINLNLSSVNITCSGSQAPIELMINCFILGFLIIVVRSDYQLLFNVLLNNVNQRFLLNNLEQQLDRGNVWFSRYFFVGIIFTGFIMINPFQVGLRYCMGFVRLNSFAKNHNVAHDVSASCDDVPGARYFDSFLGYTSTIFAWWLILPAVYCLAEVVVPRCSKTDSLTKIKAKNFSKKGSSKIMPAELVIDGTVYYSKKVDPVVCDPESGSDEEKGEDALQMVEKAVADEISFIEEDDIVQLREPQFPKQLSSKFSNVDEDTVARIYYHGYKDRVKEEKESGKDSTHERVSWKVNRNEELSYIRKTGLKITEKMPFLRAFYYYCKEKYFRIISVDLWVSNAFLWWIDLLQQNNPKNIENDKKQGVKRDFLSAKQSSFKRPGMKQLLSLDSEQFMQSMKIYDQSQLKKQSKLDLLWQKEQLQNNYTLPSYYELSHVVQEELHDFIIQPFAGFIAFMGIGHFLTRTGRYYWTVVFHNYKVFLLVCLGIWTDEAVEAYNLKETSNRLAVDDRVFLKPNVEKKEIASTKLKKTSRKFSAQFLGFTVTQVTSNGSGAQHPQHARKDINKKNVSEVLPVIISILICSRVILFQVVPSLVLFATISMTLASFPLFIFNEFLAETLPPLIIWGEINREMSIERELKSFIPLHPETKQPLSEEETMKILTEEYSWRISLRGIILFWNESRLLQFVHSSLALFFSFILLIYSPELLVYLIVILALLIPFILSKSLVLLLYLGNSLDMKDTDFPHWWIRKTNINNQNTAKVDPDIEEPVAVPVVDDENCFPPDEEEVRMEEEEEEQVIRIVPEETHNGHVTLSEIVHLEDPQVEKDDHSISSASFSSRSYEDLTVDSLPDSWILSPSSTINDSLDDAESVREKRVR
jgi:hypothetical protein